MWNLLAIAAPLVGLVACAAVASATRQGSDLAGGLGGLFRGTLALAALCGIGTAAAIAAIARHERPGWLGVALALLNLVLMLPGLWVLIRMDWE